MNRAATLSATAEELTLTHLELLETVAAYETEEAGVRFNQRPRGRWEHSRTRRVFSDSLFQGLDILGYLDTGDGSGAEIRVTQAGLDWVAARRGRR